VLAWLSVWSEVQIVCIWSSWCHCHPKTPSSLASFKSRLVLPSWCRFTQVVLEKRPLNGCSGVSWSERSPLCVCVCVCVCVCACARVRVRACVCACVRVCVCNRCTLCTRVRYCSKACCSASWDCYHRIECKFMDLLHAVGQFSPSFTLSILG